MGFSLINHSFWGTHFRKPAFSYIFSLRTEREQLEDAFNIFNNTFTTLLPSGHCRFDISHLLEVHADVYTDLGAYRRHRWWARWQHWSDWWALLQGTGCFCHLGTVVQHGLTELLDSGDRGAFSVWVQYFKTLASATSHPEKTSFEIGRKHTHTHTRRAMAGHGRTFDQWPAKWRTRALGRPLRSHHVPGQPDPTETLRSQGRGRKMLVELEQLDVPVISCEPKPFLCP